MKKCYDITVRVNPLVMDKYEFETLAEQQFGIRFDELDWTRDRDNFFDKWDSICTRAALEDRTPDFELFMKKVDKVINEDLPWRG